MLKHAENIQTIMIAIKPGIFNHFFKRFDKDMIKDYFAKLRDLQENFEAMIDLSKPII